MKPSKSNQLLSIATTVLLLVSTSPAQRPPRVTGFFSNMQGNPETGDVLGAEVWIVYARGAYYACVQDAEGEPDAPVVVPVQVSGNQVKFTIRTTLKDGYGRPAPDLVLNYIGRVTNAGLTLSVAHAGEEPSGGEEILERRTSYWQ